MTTLVEDLKKASGQTVPGFKKTSGLTVPGFKRKDALTTSSDIINNPTINGTVSKENQDNIFFDYLTLDGKEIKILIVCDGHGILYGSNCSKFVTKYLHSNIIKCPATLKDNVEYNTVSYLLL